MNLSICALMITAVVLWGGAVLFCGIANLIWPAYGVAFLQVVSSVYPGYHATRSLGSVVIGTLYALLDGAICGLLIGWLYNRFARA
jgi:ABC-type nitrate/sulfonate/bicarbonate transport system permease component